jgi:hypothetical protein
VRAVAAKADAALIRVLQASGFAEHSALPLHVLANRDEAVPLQQLQGLSYLDDDLAQIFE